MVHRLTDVLDSVHDVLTRLQEGVSGVIELQEDDADTVGRMLSFSTHATNPMLGMKLVVQSSTF